MADAQRHGRGRLGVHSVVRTRTRSLSLIRALLRQQGYRVPSGSAEAVGHRVAALPLRGRLLSTVAPLLAIRRTSASSPASSVRARPGTAAPVTALPA